MQQKRRKLKRTRVGEKGQITLPIEVRRKLGVKKGDTVDFTETDGGYLLTSKTAIDLQALDEIGAILREKGITLEEMSESGRAIRGELIKELYGLEEPLSDEKH